MPNDGVEGLSWQHVQRHRSGGEKSLPNTEPAARPRKNLPVNTGLGVKSVNRWHRRLDDELNLLPESRPSRKSGSAEPPKATAAPVCTGSTAAFGCTTGAGNEAVSNGLWKTTARQNSLAGDSCN